MNPEQSFTKDNPAYPGMIGLIAAVTATTCKCSRCERLRSYLPPNIGDMAQSESFKAKTKQMYEGYKPPWRDRTPEQLARRNAYEREMRRRAREQREQSQKNDES